MTLRNLVPWRNRKGLALRKGDSEHPVMNLRRQMDDLFDDFFGGSVMEPFREWADASSNFMPSVDVSETDKEISITAELPGMDEKDIELTLNEDSLTIRGEKKEEHEDKKKGVYHMERSYGSFHRTVPLPAEIDPEKTRADFKKGVLTVTLPKVAEVAGKSRRITIQAE